MYPLKSSVNKRVMVCVSTYPNSLQLLRRGARSANYMNARLYVVFVAHPDRFLTHAENLHVEMCERMCQEFSGELIRVESHDVSQAIADS